MSDDDKHETARRKPLIDFLMTVDSENRLPIPQIFAENFNIEPGALIIFVDSGKDVEFTVRVLQSSYAGALTGVFGTTEESVTYVREERDSWNALEERLQSAALDDLAQQFIYAELLGNLTRHFDSFRTARLWFDTQQPALDNKTPLTAIEAGDHDAVIALAHIIASLSPD
jgi:bifunctional DNA-binding transcriptional regulator/antitoxin component of YhaV-PrlF toxin-antitoxin module